MPSESFDTLTVSPGIRLAFIDSGPPAVFPYTTIFAVHGICFTNLVFKKLHRVAFENDFRFVSINRRPYAGSTPFDPDDVAVITSGGDLIKERAAFIESRGHELASFVDIFAQTFGLPPISHDGKPGGSIIYGWSMGSQLVMLTLAHINTLTPAVRSRLAQQIRALIFYDAAPYFFGFPNAEKSWAPLIDNTIPEPLRLPMFGQWVSAYFDNGDYFKRDYSTLAYVLPSTDRMPTIFKDDMGDTASYGQDAALDLLLVFKFVEPLRKAFDRAFNEPDVADVFPRLKIRFVCGDRSPSFGISGLWTVQEKFLAKSGLGNRVTYEIVKGANHFLHWDDPQRALELITAEAVSRKALL